MENLLDGERAERGPIHDGAAHIGVAQVAGFREVPHESAGERIAGPGWIEHRLERIRWSAKKTESRREHEGAVFAFLNDDVCVGPRVHDPARCR